MHHRYEVGKPYNPTRTSWPEGSQYNWRGGAHELLLFFNRPSAAERRAVTSGMAEFALLVEPTVLFLLYRFTGGIDWSDAPYSIHRLPEAERMAPEPLTPDGRRLVTTLLVNAATGILEVIRVSTFSHDFSVALDAAIRDQLAAPFSDAAYNRSIDEAYRKYRTSTQMLRSATYRCAAGD